jgi:hypothetical protein
MAHVKATFEEPRHGGQDKANIQALDGRYPQPSMRPSDLVTSAMYAMGVRPTGLRG